MLNHLERIFGRFAIPNLSLYIIIGQVFVLFARMLNLLPVENLAFVPAAVIAGEWWRVFTFMFLVPVPTTLFGYVFAVFGWFLFYQMGNALEHFWGVFRYNFYLFFSFALTVGLSFLVPGAYVTNLYIIGSVFLAFAFLNPDFELLLFMILPLKVKWLALFTWALYAVNFFLGSWALRLQIAAPTITFLLFFGALILRRGQQQRRVAAHRVERVREEAKPRHVCHVCGKTDLTHPELDFRYCSKCEGDQCYCPEHIHNHAHVVAPQAKDS